MALPASRRAGAGTSSLEQASRVRQTPCRNARRSDSVIPSPLWTTIPRRRRTRQRVRVAGSGGCLRHKTPSTRRLARRRAAPPDPGRRSPRDILLGFIRDAINDLPGSADAFRSVLRRDSAIADKTGEPSQLRKVIVRAFLRVGSPAEARAHLKILLDRRPDPETYWLLSRDSLQEGSKAEFQSAWTRAASYRNDHPLENEPALYIGEARSPSATAPSSRSRWLTAIPRRTTTGLNCSRSHAQTRPGPTPTTPRPTIRSERLRASSGRRRALATR